MPDDVEIILEISEDKNFLRVDLGTKGYQNKKHEESLDYFESRSKLKWYLFIKSGNNILARIENLEPTFPNDADSSFQFQYIISILVIMFNNRQFNWHHAKLLHYYIDIVRLIDIFFA